MASVTEKRLLVGFDDLGIPDWTQVEFLTFAHEIKLCSLCGVVSSTTASVACRHVLCSFCFRDQGGDGAVVTCPIDKVPTPSSRVKFERNNTDLLLSLRAACMNRRNGCRVLDTLQGMKEHLKQCEYQAVQCQMCGKKIKLHEVPGHARKDCSRIHKVDSSSKRLAGTPTRPVPQPKPVPMEQQPMVMGAPQMMPPQPMMMQPMPMAPPQIMAPPVPGPPPVMMQQGPRFEEVALMQQKVTKMYEDVRKMSAKVQALKDETGRELEHFKKDLQKMKNEKGDYSVIVNAITGLRSQMNSNMADVSDEFDAIKEDMRLYGATIEDLGTLKETMEMRIGDVVRNVESLRDSLEEYAKLSSTVAEMKSSIVAIQDMKHVMEFVDDFEQTLLGDISGSSGDKKKAFTQQVEMLKRCVEVIDELKSTVKHKDMEQVVCELRMIKDDLGRYSMLHDKVEGITTDLTGLKAVVKDAGDFAKSDTSLTEECRTELEKYRAEIKILHERVQKIAKDVDDLKSTSEGEKDKVAFDEVVTEVTNLKTKLEEFDVLEESLQETKDALLRMNVLSDELNELREKTVKIEQAGDSSGDTAKKLEEITAQLAGIQTAHDGIVRLQACIQTLNKRVNRKIEELQTNIEASISEKIGALQSPTELTELKASIAKVKKDVELLNELKESLPAKSSGNQDLEEVVKDLKALKTNMQSLQESSTSTREREKRYDDLRKSVDAIKESMKDYEEFKANFVNLRKTVEEKLNADED